jgi:hypothetical protein
MSLDHTIMIPLLLSLLSPYYYHYPIIRPSKNPLSLSQKGGTSPEREAPPSNRRPREPGRVENQTMASWKIHHF